MTRTFFARISRRSRLLLATGLLTVIGVAGSLVATSAPAMASAVGCTRYGSVYIPVVKFSIPTGQYCFGINGSGATVNFTDGSVDTAWIVNYSETVRFYDGHGHNYYTYNGPVHAGYAYSYHYWQTSIHGSAVVGGRVCGTLMSSGTAVATACESIL
jgi:hypothetical protein